MPETAPADGEREPITKLTGIILFRRGKKRVLGLHDVCSDVSKSGRYQATGNMNVFNINRGNL